MKLSKTAAVKRKHAMYKYLAQHLITPPSETSGRCWGSLLVIPSQCHQSQPLLRTLRAVESLLRILASVDLWWKALSLSLCLRKAKVSIAISIF